MNSVPEQKPEEVNHGRRTTIDGITVDLVNSEVIPEQKESYSIVSRMRKQFKSMVLTPSDLP